MPTVKKVFTFNHHGHLRKNTFIQVFALGVFTFLLAGLLSILVRIFSKFRVISQIWEYRENVKTLRVFT